MPRLTAFGVRRALVLAALAALVPSLASAGAPTARPGSGAVWVGSLATGMPPPYVPEVSLSAFRNGVAYAHVFDGPTYFKSTDYGRTWNAMPPPPTESALDTPRPETVRFATPTLGYAVQGRWGGATSNGDAGLPCRRGDTGVSRTEDGGATWVPVCLRRNHPGTWFDRGMADVKNVTVAPGTRTLAVVGYDVRPFLVQPDYSTAQGVIYTSHDGGVHWVRGALPRHFVASVYPMDMLGAADAVVTAVDMKLRRDGSADPSYPAHAGVLRTSDGGRSWHEILSCGDGRVRATCTSAALVTRNRIVVGYGDGRTSVTDDGGRTWRAGQPLVSPRTPADVAWEATHHPFETRGLVQDIDFLDGWYGYALTNGAGVWRTADGGETWTQEQTPECREANDPFGGEIAVLAPDRAVAGGRYVVSTRVPVGPESDAVRTPTCGDPG
jgi:photosystem II stability/assembly factor-like uncharacterized protein